MAASGEAVFWATSSAAGGFKEEDEAIEVEDEDEFNKLEVGVEQ